jgi:hypothetical protein
MAGAAAAGQTAPAASAAAEPAPSKPLEPVPVARSAWPSGVTTPGDTIEASLRFLDKNGTHFLVMSSREVPETDTWGSEPEIARYLYVDDWLAAPDRPRSLVPVGDMVTHCPPGQLSAKFHEAATRITDVDHDGVAEVAFAYEESCRSDARPGSYRLVLLTSGSRYTLRGETRIEAGGGALAAPSSYEPDPPAEQWPAGYLDHARQLWDQTADDLERPPHPRDAK